jgi:hypothetical protein
MGHVAISKDLITDYAVTDKFAIDVARLKNVLKNVGDEVELVFKQGTIDVISDKLVQHMAVPAYEEKEIRLPSLQPTGTVMFESTPFNRLLKAAGLGLDSCRITINENAGVSFKTKNVASDGVELSVAKDECVSIEGVGSAIYSIAYLREFLAVVPKGALIEIRLADECPMAIEYGDTQFLVTWVLAPWISYDDDE